MALEASYVCALSMYMSGGDEVMKYSAVASECLPCDGRVADVGGEFSSGPRPVPAHDATQTGVPLHNTCYLRRLLDDGNPGA